MVITETNGHSEILKIEKIMDDQQLPALLRILMHYLTKPQLRIDERVLVVEGQESIVNGKYKLW